MIRKILLGLTAGTLLLLVLVTAYLLSIKVERPDERPEVISFLHKEEFRNSSLKAEEWLEATYARFIIPSLSVAVGISGDLVWTGTIGYADLANGVPANENTTYRVGSISKSITASAAMRMQEKGLIDIDMPFNRYVKDYSSGNASYTVAHLLTHQAGIRHYNDEFSENFSTREYASTREAASIVEHDNLLFAPGTDFNYSTYGYTLAALAMESAYSLPFEEIMVKEVFSPAGMTSTRFDKANQINDDNTAKPYLLVGGYIFESPDVNLSYKYAGGGILSTPSDIVRFGHALLEDGFLGLDSRERLWSPVPLDSGDMNPEYYALGFRVEQDELGSFVHQGGLSVGGYSFFAIYPEIEIVVAFATNTTPTEPIFDRLEAARQLVNAFRNQ